MVRKDILRLSLGVAILITLAATVSGRATYLISEFTSGQRAASDLQSWNVRNSEGPLVTTLNGVSIVGGHGSFGSGAELSKHYRQLPDHYKLKVEFIFYGIESWEDERFFLEADGRQVFSIANTCDCNQASHPFGTDLHTKVQKVEVEFAHYRSDLLLKFSSDLDEPALNESWGISDLQISYVTCEGDCLVITDELSNANFDVSPYSFSPEPQTEISSCNNGKQIVGGPGAFSLKQHVSRTFNDLPPHSEITVHFLVFFFGEFDREAFRVSVDETGSRNEVSVLNPLLSSGEEGSFCSSNAREEIRDVVLTFPHTSGEATIHFFDEAFDGSSSWGISDVRVYVNPCRGGKRCKVIANEIFGAKSKLRGWKLPSGENIPADFSNTCANRVVLGGLGKVSKENLTKRYKKLKPHNEVSISFKFYKFGAWSATDVVHVLVDNEVRRTIVKTNGQDTLACGSAQKNVEVENIQITVPHSSSNVRVTFVSTLCKESSEHAYGFREFYVQAKQGRGVELVARDFTVSHDGSDLLGWTMDPVNQSPFSKCGSKALFGGLSVFTGSQRIFKQYTSLPAHQWVKVVFNAFFINAWPGEGLDVYADGRRIGTIYRLNSKKALKSSLVCGSNEETGDEFITESVTFQHSLDSITVEFRSFAEDDSNSSWGLNNIQVWTVNDLPDAATDGSTPVDEFKDYERDRVPFTPEQDNVHKDNVNPFFAPPQIRRHRRKPKQFVDPEDEVCAEPVPDTTEEDDEKNRIKSELERQIEETQKQLDGFKGQLRDIHPDHPYVQDDCKLPTPQEKEVIEKIVEEIRVIEEKIEELENIEDPTPEQVQELEDAKVELEVKQEVLKVEEQKYEEKIEKYEEQEEKKPEYKVKCSLNQDVIQGLINQVKETKGRMSKRYRLIHALRLQVANSDNEEDKVSTLQARIAKNENSNKVAEAKITKLEARINRLETVCKPLKKKEIIADVVQPKDEVKEVTKEATVAKAKKTKKVCKVHPERIEKWENKVAQTRARIARRQRNIDALKQQLTTAGRPIEGNAKINQAEDNQEKAKNRVAKLLVKIENETYKCSPREDAPASPEVAKLETVEEVEEFIEEKTKELEELKEIPDPTPEEKEKIEELEVVIEEAEAKKDEIEMDSIQEETVVEEKKQEIAKEKKRIRTLKRKLIKKPKERKKIMRQIKKAKKQIKKAEEEVKVIEEKIEEKAPEIAIRKEKVKKQKLRRRAKKLEEYIAENPQLPVEEKEKIEEEIKVIEAQVEIIEKKEEAIIEEARAREEEPAVVPDEEVVVPEEEKPQVQEEEKAVEPEPVVEEDCCTAMHNQIEALKKRIARRNDKIKLLKKGLKICTLNKEALRLKIYQLQAANKKAQRKIKEIEYLYANFGTCVEETQIEEEPEPLIPEPIPGCKRVNSVDSRYVKRVAKIAQLKKLIAQNPKKDNRNLKRKLAKLEKAQEQALYIRDKIDCDEKPEIVIPEPEPVPEPVLTPEETIRGRIAKRKDKIRRLREVCSKNPSLKKQQKLEHLEEQNEQDFIRLGGLLRKQKKGEGREEQNEVIREQVDQENASLSNEQRVQRIRDRVAKRDRKIRILQNRCLNNNAIDNSKLEEKIVQLEAANEQALQKIAEINGTSILAELTAANQ